MKKKTLDAMWKAVSAAVVRVLRVNILQELKGKQQRNYGEPDKLGDVRARAG